MYLEVIVEIVYLEPALKIFVLSVVRGGLEEHEEGKESKERKKKPPGIICERRV